MQLEQAIVQLTFCFAVYIERIGIWIEFRINPLEFADRHSEYVVMFVSFVSGSKKE